MQVPDAQIIADSISPDNHRLTTMEITCHRFVLAEFNTHRAFSRNSASSRAIPFQKQIRLIEDRGIAYPLVWPAEQRGMQGGEALDQLTQSHLVRLWTSSYSEAKRTAELLYDAGLHKSVVNRLLEPFMWHKIIVSSTEWGNFFKQRCSPLAQPEIRATAEAMREALFASTPRDVHWGDWHRPYMEGEDLVSCTHAGEDPNYVSAMRCARVSYLTHDGHRDVQEDAAGFFKLVSADPPHWSPLEHVATPHRLAHEPGNFQGWRQLRHLYAAEQGR